MSSPEISVNEDTDNGGLGEVAARTGFSTAELFDAHEFEDLVKVCDTAFLRFGRRRSFSGRCETVLTYEDHKIVLEVLQQPGDGRVLVVEGGGNRRVGVMGDRLAKIGSANGWSGVIVNGAIRDSELIDELDFGVFGVALTARRSARAERGRQSVDVHFGGVMFHPGDWVYADANSVLCSTREL